LQPPKRHIWFYLCTSDAFINKIIVIIIVIVIVNFITVQPPCSTCSSRLVALIHLPISSSDIMSIIDGGAYCAEYMFCWSFL